MRLQQIVVLVETGLVVLLSPKTSAMVLFSSDATYSSQQESV
jgi:hypothetical protein